MTDQIRIDESHPWVQFDKLRAAEVWEKPIGPTVRRYRWEFIEVDNARIIEFGPEDGSGAKALDILVEADSKVSGFGSIEPWVFYGNE